MHSIYHRLNTAVTFFGTVAAVLCILTSSTDLLHKSNPNIKLGLREVRRLVQHHGGKDQAVVTFDVNADLRSVFTWNTKQLFVYVQAEYETQENRINEVVLWDSIVQQKDKAVFKLSNHKTKYAFIDPGHNLRGRDVNLTLVWCVMPRVGRMYTERHTVSVGKMPATYI
ncbi:hypothetical protein CHLRE_14g620400v5 [Chlamydomonas reinhardtii]|uniref:Signal peptidase complex subunit 3 n=1 Tax=Chlamydomonas reinhardtii TaxID=3055 RepID=A8HP31_CHLRE|nr:uncharacterized protein CHLRE_14g620400v5 [Chlamydomonas reinhardtii]PNW73144.1 hypothetical protein CHLRE_14g620400v5 [Chlamydomonas reinhardtii]|eukprot:XP_001690306.1 signal peptidase, 22 kDa subunit [Chlamydomonas reinhardtii]